MALVAPLLKVQPLLLSNKIQNISRPLTNNSKSSIKVLQLNRQQLVTQTRRDTINRQPELMVIWLKGTSRMINLDLISDQAKPQVIKLFQTIRLRALCQPDSKTLSPKPQSTNSSKISIFMGTSNSLGTITSTDISPNYLYVTICLILFHSS